MTKIILFVHRSQGAQAIHKLGVLDVYRCRLLEAGQAAVRELERSPVPVRLLPPRHQAALVATLGLHSILRPRQATVLLLLLLERQVANALPVFADTNMERPHATTILLLELLRKIHPSALVGSVPNSLLSACMVRLVQALTSARIGKGAPMTQAQGPRRGRARRAVRIHLRADRGQHVRHGRAPAHEETVSP